MTSTQETMFNRQCDCTQHLLNAKLQVFADISGSCGKSMKGKMIISKSAAVIYVIVTILVILTVGLLVGLVGRSQSNKCETPPMTSTSATSTPGVITSTTAAATTRQPTGPWDNIRLPPNLVPTNYVVDLQPVLTPDAAGMYWFNGTSSVTFEVKSATDHIYIHSNRLNYSSLSLADATGAVAQITTFWLHVEYQYLIVQLDSVMSVGTNYVLTTEFKGELADDLGGLYRSTYKNQAGKDVVIATTQMLPTDTRKAFPCFDEPALKATFDIYLWFIEPYFALSNMPVKETVSMYGNWKRSKFDQTPIMNAYLLAFVVCDFQYVEMTTSEIQTRIYARKQQVDDDNADYAAALTPVILRRYTEYFNVSYPLPKYDQISVGDFPAGAMENWGLVIYRETALLYNPTVNSASNKQRVAVVVAHELVHQWFGNLISPDWWDEIWLNEGFATYIQYLGTDEVEPTWRMRDQFVVSDLQRALRVDGLTTSRPIVALNISTPSEINSLFDTISYSKGACVLRMINEFIGEEAFTGGLTNYLKDNEYGSVNHEALFNYWTNEYIKHNKTLIPGNFTEAMNTWILQMGFPTITMKRTASDETTVVITQERFLLDTKADPAEPTSPYAYKWTTPLWYIQQEETNKSLMWISKDASSEKINVTVGKYFLGNFEAFGYYRVNYDDDNWLAITAALISNHNDVDVRTRGQLLNDAFNLARANKLDYTIAFGLTEFLRKDYDYISWESALAEMSYFDLVLGRSKVYGPYSEYLIYLVGPVYTNLTWNDGGTHLEQYQRINAIGAACTYGVPGCVTTALQKFNEWQNSSTNNISPNLRTIVYCQAVANGDAEQWDFVWEQYLNEANSQEKAKLQYALTCTRIPWIIRRFLVNYALNDNFVRKQDTSSVLQDLCHNEYARDITWDYIRQEWDYIYGVYGTDFFSFSGIISSCTSHFSTEFERDELQAFKDQNEGKLGSGLGTVNQALESTQTNIDWRAANEENVFLWLTNKLQEIGSI